jgi:iron-sulfur cluster repair protein YtfE (RIC family)
MSQAAIQASFTDITAYLSHDHQRLDALLSSARAEVLAGLYLEAGHSFTAFEAGLVRHMHLEEALVFPLFELKTGLTSGPTGVMREEHGQIRRALGLMRDGLDRADLGAFRAGARFLDEVMPGHDAKEESVLYPMTDRVLTDAERLRFVARLMSEPV